MGEDARGLLRALRAIDRRAAVRGACLCARSVAGSWIHPEPPRAVELAEAWIEGRSSPSDCRTASRAAHGSAYDSYPSGGRAAANAAHAAGYAAGAVRDPEDAARAADAAATAVGNTAGRAWREASARHLAELAEALRAVPWPRVVPTPAEVVSAPAGAQVAWDWLSVRPAPEQTLGTLLEAHARAERLGLDWADPVQRAVAERAVDEAAVLLLLRGT